MAIAKNKPNTTCSVNPSGDHFPLEGGVVLIDGPSNGKKFWAGIVCANCLETYFEDPSKKSDRNKKASGGGVVPSPLPTASGSFVG